MDTMEAARALGQVIRDSAECREYARLKAEIDADAGIKALVNEYKRLQTAMQMRMLAGQSLEGEEAQRFQSLNMLLFADSRTAGYLMAEMRLQQMLADIFRIVTEAADVDMSIPGLDG